MKSSFLKVSTLLLLSLFSVQLVHAQDETEEEVTEPSEIHLFRGGYMNLGFGLNLNTVGSSLGSGSMGGLVSSRVENNSRNLNLNPALLGYMKTAHISFSSRLGVGSHMNSSLNSSLLSTVNDEISSATQDEFNNTDSWIKFPDTYIKPTEVRGLDVGFRGDISSISFAAPIYDRLVIAGAYTYPTTIDFNLGVTGMTAKLAQEQGTDEVSIRFDVLMNISLLTQMSFQVNALSGGFGYSFFEDDAKQKLALGATFTRYQVNNTRSLLADLSGMVVVGGADERYFNNSSDPNLNYENGETNAFYMNANGNYQATEYGYKIGLNYSPAPVVNLSLVYDMVPDFELEGTDVVAEAYLPIFIVGSGSDILAGEIEVALDSLQANKPNLTTFRDISDITDNGSLKMPSSLKLGIDLSMGRHTAVLNYTSYLSEFSFTHGGNTIGKDLKHGIGVGFDFKLKDRLNHWSQIFGIPVRLLFLDIDGYLFQIFGKYTGYKDSHYRFGGNVLLGEGIDFSDQSRKDILGAPLPQSFSMGRQYTIFENFEVGVSVLAVPDLMLKYSVGVKF